MTDYSIIIPFYNEKERIENASQNVRDFWNQNKKNILFIDDGSTDNGLESIAGKFDCIRYDKNQQKIGAVYSALKNKNVNGEYVFLTDIDSRIEGNFGNTIDYLEKNKYDGASIHMLPENSKNLLEILQTMEYKLSDFVKKTLSNFSKQYVIPGASGVYKQDVLYKSLEMLKNRGLLYKHAGDDQRITLQAIRNKSRLGFVPKEMLKVRTNVPSSAKELFQQRYKWHEGTLDAYNYFNKETLFSFDALSALGGIQLLGIATAPFMFKNIESFAMSSLTSLILVPALTAAFEKPSAKEIIASACFPAYSLSFNLLPFFKKLGNHLKK
jgi:cellulose synthase/poly-beta-1,6-N-acetylglucosamine synthase-like glycosyltransferase